MIGGQRRGQGNTACLSPVRSHRDTHEVHGYHPLMWNIRSLLGKVADIEGVLAFWERVNGYASAAYLALVALVGGWSLVDVSISAAVTNVIVLLVAGALLYFRIIEIKEKRKNGGLGVSIEGVSADELHSANDVAERVVLLENFLTNQTKMLGAILHIIVDATEKIRLIEIIGDALQRLPSNTPLNPDASLEKLNQICDIADIFMSSTKEEFRLIPSLEAFQWVDESAGHESFLRVLDMVSVPLEHQLPFRNASVAQEKIRMAQQFLLKQRKAADSALVQTHGRLTEAVARLPHHSR
ncbi:hypothetical protein [Falsiroseomonas sp. E2-1-a4]|uniref:hypothetical protein n=1 Tax=Falsiroseomonas sp. E2-1-a4 TaxID=3239299 RepID=UPI003F41B274